MIDFAHRFKNEMIDLPTTGYNPSRKGGLSPFKHAQKAGNKSHEPKIRTDRESHFGFSYMYADDRGKF
jgi:hypothetical protein